MGSTKKTMSVQNVIDRLMQVDDKSQPFEVGVHLTEAYPGADGDDERPRVIDYIGQHVILTPYENQHRPENQKYIEGVPFNPQLREDFDRTPNDERDPQEVTDWWGTPYIVTQSWEEWERHYDEAWKANTPQLDHEAFLAEQKEEWYAAWPSGTRYDVRCLDGGAWDRSTSWGMVGSLAEAVAIAKAKP